MPPPGLRSRTAHTVLAYRPKPSTPSWQPIATVGPQHTRRTYADSAAKEVPKFKEGKGPNENQLPHVSEEAAGTKQAMGEKGPDISQGTPVNEVRSPYDAQYEEYAYQAKVLKDDKKAQKNLPKVMKDEIKADGKRSYSTYSRIARRQYSTSARRQVDLSTYQGRSVIPPEMIYHSPAYAAFLGRFPEPVRQTALSTLPATQPETAVSEEAMPKRPLHHHRYEPIVDQMVGLMIRDGKKSVAQRNMTHILAQLRTSPPPAVDERHPLLPGAPPPSYLPLNPILYLQLAVDSVAPLLRIKNIKGAAGGGMALQLPTSLNQRQRRRIAMKWILDAASKRKHRGSGKTGFAQRVAEELIAVVEGKSGVWDRRNGVHKMGVTARANVVVRQRKRK